MKMKRGTDHNWEVRRYKCDLAWYAHCKCGYQYNCSRPLRNEDGSWNFKQYVAIIYPYCPNCGARKKYYNEEPIRVDKDWPYI